MCRYIHVLVAALYCFNPAAWGHNNEQHSEKQEIPSAIGYGNLGYPLPEIGSYELPPLGDAADGAVLDSDGNEKTLHGLFEGKYIILNFVYSHCSDVNGCPLATMVSHQIKNAMQKDAELAASLRLVSLSFDPERDTPSVMRAYKENYKYAGKKGEWKFITTESEQKLEPILQAYGQDVQREAQVNGDPGGNISHILRVFLIDPEFRIRNIYSVEFLHADLVINDIKTLIRQQNTAVPDSERTRRISYLSAPGDSKDGYESAAYQTQSRALDRRSQKGKSMDLLAIARNPPLGLPEIDAQQLKTLSPEKIDLGKLLFFDRRLSLNDTFSCAMCHVPEQGFTSNELSMAVGIEGRSVRRNTPTIFNVAYAKRLFHDGRENALDQQVWGPLLAKNEMGNPSIGYVVDKIRNIEGYEAMFTEAFKGRGIDMQTIGQALAAYQTTLVSADSDFDRWYFGKQPQALSEQARHGFRLFTGKANCSSCHVISTQSALFTDNLLHNTGIGYRESMGIRPDKERVLIAPGVYVDVERKMIEEVGHKPPPDLGLYEITENPHDRWKYKTPTLRNIALTAPYMHNGSIGTLREVVQFYNGGGVPNALLDTRIKPLDLTEGEIDSLVAFLESLTGSNVDLIVSDAFSVPVGDLQHSDPNWANVIGISNR